MVRRGHGHHGTLLPPIGGGKIKTLYRFRVEGESDARVSFFLLGYHEKIGLSNIFFAWRLIFFYAVIAYG
jgi:hypothetical protein